MKKLISILFALLLCLLPTSIYAQEETSYQWILMDAADLLSSKEEEALYEYIEPLLEYGNVIFSTTTLSKGSDYQKHCENVYYDHFKNEPGIHFQIDMGNRKLTLSASTDMEKLIGGERESIVDNVYNLATNGDYFSCVATCFEQILTVLNNGKIAHTMKYIDNGILALILGLLINFIFVFSTGNKKAKEHEQVVNMLGAVTVAGTTITKKKLIKEYSPVSSSDGGSSSCSGGFSGGSSSHGF